MYCDVYILWLHTPYLPHAPRLSCTPNALPFVCCSIHDYQTQLKSLGQDVTGNRGKMLHLILTICQKVEKAFNKIVDGGEGGEAGQASGLDVSGRVGLGGGMEGWGLACRVLVTEFRSCSSAGSNLREVHAHSGPGALLPSHTRAGSNITVAAAVVLVGPKCCVSSGRPSSRAQLTPLFASHHPCHPLSRW